MQATTRLANFANRFSSNDNCKVSLHFGFFIASFSFSSGQDTFRMVSGVQSKIPMYWTSVGKHKKRDDQEQLEAKQEGLSSVQQR